MTFPLGINMGTLPESSAQYTLNALNSSVFWQTCTSGTIETNEEWNLNCDPNGFPISITTGADGTALTATSALLVVLQSQVSPYLYPDGVGSWTFQWIGQGSFNFLRDVTSPASSSSSPATLNVTATAQGIGVGLTSTGISATVTFSGTTVSWTSSNFTANTPVAFQSSGTLPSPLVANTVYYVLAASLGANSFQIATTVGGSPITFSGGSGTHKGFGDWARNISLCQTKYLTNLSNGEQWNPDYTAKFKKFSPIRFMQTQNTYTGNLKTATVTFSGTTVNWSGSSFSAGYSVTFINSGGSLPSPLVINTRYFVLQAGLTANSFQISTTLGGSPITFSGGSGTTTGYGNAVMSGSDITPAGYLTWGGASYNNVGGRSFGGPPIEAMCALCNEQNADMWINIPPMSDSSWDIAAATIVLANLNSNLKVYVETSNEIWSQANNLVPGWAAWGLDKFPSPTGNNTTFMYGVYRMIQAHANWKSVFAASPSRIIRVAGGQLGNDGYSEFVCDMLATDYGGSASYWTGAAYTHFDAVCGAVYMNGGEEIPDAWTNDSDAGQAKFLQEYNTGGILPTSASPTHVAGGTSTAYTVTSGQSLPATPPNGTIINIDFSAVGTNGANATLAADGGTAFPLQYRTGMALPATWLPIIVPYIGPFVFTSAVNPSWGSVSTPGWRSQPLGNLGPPAGYMSESVVWVNNMYANVTSPRGLKLFCYEGGQTMSDFGFGDTVQMNYTIASNRSNDMGTLYTTFFNQMKALNKIDVFVHFADVSIPGDFGNWGALESTYQTTSPKYQALLNFIDGGSHGGHSWLGRFGQLEVGPKEAVLFGAGAILKKNPVVTRRFTKVK